MDEFWYGHSLANALWGRSRDDLRRQLLARYPYIPSGFGLADLRELQQHAHIISQAGSEPAPPRKVLIDRAAIPAVAAAILPSAKLKSNRKEFVMEKLTMQEMVLFGTVQVLRVKDRMRGFCKEIQGKP